MPDARPSPLQLRSKRLSRNDAACAGRRLLRVEEGRQVKRPPMIAVAGVEPFALAGLWENWKDPESGEWIRTFHHYHDHCQ